MLSDLPLCIGKLLDLSACTLFTADAIKKLEPFTLTAQRREPEDSALRSLPPLPAAALEFATPPEWTVTIKVPKGAAGRAWVAGGGLTLIRKAQAEALKSPTGRKPSGEPTSPLAGGKRQSSTTTISPFDLDDDEADFLTQRLDVISPLPPADVYLFGCTVKAIFAHVLDADAAANRAEKAGADPGSILLARSTSLFSSVVANSRESAHEERARHLSLAAQSVTHATLVGAPECTHFVAQATLPTRCGG
jgi:hypothetical protein